MNSPSPRPVLRRLLAPLWGAALLFSPNALATVVQPGTTLTMPQPANPDELTCCVTGRGFPADADTLAGVFKYHELIIDGVPTAGLDMSMDATRDAQTAPGTFSPQCGLHGTIVLKGGDCKNELRWYNATTPPSKPAMNQMYPLVPGDLMAAPMMCKENGFCPLATRITTQPGQHTWADPLPEYAADIRTSPNWKGGQVGFALVPPYVGSTPQGKCTQVKYSEMELNDKNSAGQPWISALIYHSVADPNAYYIAFEDQPTCTASWKGCNPGQSTPLTSGGNDGDFNDFVFYVSGLTCKDGGQPCTVPDVQGICAGGVTECQGGGLGTTCRQAVKPTTEACDAVDNDCDGEVDEGDLCGAGSICDHGTCVHPCAQDTEFKCVSGYTCDPSGYCKDPRCIGVTCGSDQVCVGGVCSGGCDGVICPHGQTCRVGHCVEPCAGVTCDGGRICEDGACQPACGDCRDCAVGRTCTTTGAKKGVCAETGCENKTCAAGQICMGGTCKDGCEGVRCPAAQECKAGQCVPMAIPDGPPPPPPPPPLDGGGTLTGLGGGIGSVGTGGSLGIGGSGITGAGGRGGGHVGGVKSCNCDTAEGPGAGAVALVLMLLAVGAARRGRRDELRVRIRRR